MRINKGDIRPCLRLQKEDYCHSFLKVGKEDVVISLTFF